MPKITKLRLNVSKLCLEIMWLLFSGLCVYTENKCEIAYVIRNIQAVVRYQLETAVSTVKSAERHVLPPRECR